MLDCSPGSKDYHKQDNVSVDMSWPEAGKSGLAVCTVTITRGDKMVSKAKLQVTVENK
jgi:hypothetical protein